MATNKGLPWTPEELNQLLSEVRDKKAYKDLAESHGRTVNAIRFKVLGYACDQVLKEEKTVEEVASDLGLGENELNKELDRRSGKKVVKPESNELKDILSAVNRVQSLLSRYINKLA